MAVKTTRGYKWTPEGLARRRAFWSPRLTTHGLSKHPLFGTYKNIRNRCYNKRTDQYRNYGGRGIECLFRDASDFISWALEAGWSKGLTVDRKDNDGPYSRENCRIANMATQNRNSRRNRVVVINGVSMCFKDAADAAGVKYCTAMTRLARGSSSMEALGLQTRVVKSKP